ncbi:MAG: class I SAM-dependent methyltransferase [Caldilineaceae bacterium]
MNAGKSTIHWTPEQIQRFWDWHAEKPNNQNEYFSSLLGRGIVAFLEKTGKLKGNVLDYGCGPGFLCGRLLGAGVQCYGADSSEDSIRKANSQFAHKPNWKGGFLVDNFKSPFPDDFFDVVTCIETIEHLPEEAMIPLLKELKRLIKPNGIVMITTPFNEKFEEALVYCPVCESTYHKWQHMQTFTIQSLQSLLSSCCYEVLFCQNTDLRQFQRTFPLKPLQDLSFRRITDWMAFRKRRILDDFFPRPFPHGYDTQFRLGTGSGRHLCAVATKTEIVG